jgi:hypothetical protein
VIIARHALAAAVVLSSVVGCGLVASNPGVGRPASLDHVTLSTDGNSVDVVVIGGAPLSEGRHCGTDFELASSAVNGTVLQVLVRQAAEKTEDCVLTIPLPPGQPIDRVRDLSANRVRELFLEPPNGLYQLHDLPAGWEVRRAWAEWGGTWVRLYAPDADPPPWSRQQLLFRTTFGGQIVTAPEWLQPPVIVNGVEAQYLRSPDPDSQIQLQWLVEGQALTLHTYEQSLSIDQLVALAEGATAPAAP